MYINRWFTSLLLRERLCAFGYYFMSFFVFFVFKLIGTILCLFCIKAYRSYALYEFIACLFNEIFPTICTDGLIIDSHFTRAG